MYNVHMSSIRTWSNEGVVLGGVCGTSEGEQILMMSFHGEA